MIGRAAVARLALFLLSAAPVPALADTTARYAIGEGKQLLVVEIDDGGDRRVGLDGVFSLIRHGGVDYIVIEKPGAKIVARLDDAIKAMKSQMPGRPVSGDKDVIALGGGTEEVQVAGFAATSWTIGPKDSAEKKLGVAMSGDPELAPVGVVVRWLADTALSVFEDTVIPQASQFGPRLRELLAKGTPVRVAPLLELQSIDHKGIDPRRFDLPGPIASADELLEALGPSGPPAGSSTPLQPLP